MECPGKTFHAKYHGLINFEEISKCTITTPRFTLLPKSPESEKSTLVYKTKPNFIFDTEWVKVTVAFDQNNKKVTTPDEPNPWMTINPNQDEGVCLFGSHTILVNSIFMFIVTIIIILMLGISLINCLYYPPTFLQDHPLSFRSKSFSLVNCAPEEDPALPEDEVLTINKDTPVE